MEEREWQENKEDAIWNRRRRRRGKRGRGRGEGGELDKVEEKWKREKMAGKQGRCNVEWETEGEKDG